MNDLRLTRLFAIGRPVLALLLTVLLVSIVAACPNCKESLADPQQHAIATGYYYSILFMMAMPFAILGTFGGLAYLSVRRAQAQQAATDQPT